MIVYEMTKAVVDDNLEVMFTPVKATYIDIATLKIIGGHVLTREFHDNKWVRLEWLKYFSMDVVIQQALFKGYMDFIATSEDLFVKLKPEEHLKMLLMGKQYWYDIAEGCAVTDNRPFPLKMLVKICSTP